MWVILRVKYCSKPMLEYFEFARSKIKLKQEICSHRHTLEGKSLPHSTFPILAADTNIAEDVDSLENTWPDLPTLKPVQKLSEITTNIQTWEAGNESECTNTKIWYNMILKTLLQNWNDTFPRIDINPGAKTGSKQASNPIKSTNWWFQHLPNHLPTESNPWKTGSKEDKNDLRWRGGRKVGKRSRFYLGKPWFSLPRQTIVLPRKTIVSPRKTTGLPRKTQVFT